MPRRFFTADDFRMYGLIEADVREHAHAALTTWRLPGSAAKAIRGLLERTGFDPNDPIDVQVLHDPAGFILSQ